MEQGLIEATRTELPRGLSIADHKTNNRGRQGLCLRLSFSILGFYGLFGGVRLGLVHRCLTANSCHGADAVRARRNSTLIHERARRNNTLIHAQGPSPPALSLPDTGAALPDCPAARPSGLWTALLGPTGALVRGRRRRACVCPGKGGRPVQGTDGPAPLRRSGDTQTAHPATSRTAPGTPITGLRERGNDTSRSTGRSGRQNAATRRNMRREERVTVQGPVKEQQPNGMSNGGGLSVCFFFAKGADTCH